MNKTNAELFQETADTLGIECKTSSDYSGRGMYGKTTFGIVLDSWPEFAFLSARIASDLAVHHDEDSSILNDFFKDLRNIRQDNLGYQIIFY